MLESMQRIFIASSLAAGAILTGRGVASYETVGERYKAVAAVPGLNGQEKARIAWIAANRDGQENFGYTRDGRSVTKYELAECNGLNPENPAVVAGLRSVGMILANN